MEPCDCTCHQCVRGDYNYAFQHEDWYTATRLSNSPFVDVPIAYDVNDPLEAAVASGCSCLNKHVPALMPPFPYAPPKHWTPQADGEGPES